MDTRTLSKVSSRKLILARLFFGRANFTGFTCGGLRSVFLSGGFVLSSLLLDWSYTGLGDYFWSTPRRIPMATRRTPLLDPV